MLLQGALEEVPKKKKKSLGSESANSTLDESGKYLILTFELLNKKNFTCSSYQWKWGWGFQEKEEEEEQAVKWVNMLKAG